MCNVLIGERLFRIQDLLFEYKLWKKKLIYCNRILDVEIGKR